jgi:hypothetical protein
MTKMGSTPPKGIGAIAREEAARGGGGGGSDGRGVDSASRRSAAAPWPGSPTALRARPPRRPAPLLNAAGASGVRRLGVASSPPGHSHVLAGTLPVAAA